MNRSTAGTGGIYQRGEIFWIQYSFRGRKLRESSRSRKRADAVRLLKRRLGEMGSGSFVGPDAERTTFEDLVEMLFTDYSLNGRRSKPRMKSAVKHLRDFFTFARVPDISSDRIAKYIVNRQENGASNATIRYELACLRRAFRLAIRSGRASIAPYIPSVIVDNARTGFFEATEFEAVVQALPHPLRSLMRFLYLTGWRAGEAMNLKWSGIDFTAQVVRLEPGVTKNREGREFPFALLPELVALIRDQRAYTIDVERAQERIIANVFHRNGEPIRSYYGAWHSACKVAGVDGRLVHDLRRTAVRNLERAGVSRSVAMKLTGHKTEAVYRRYAITSAADLSEGVSKLAVLHGARLKLTEPQHSDTKQAQSAESREIGGATCAA